MPLLDQPPKWTRDARRKGILLGVAAIIVIFAYQWLNYSFFGILLLDALDMIGSPAPAGFWAVIGLATLIALPIVVIDSLARRATRRRR